ncbi:MULTISPECIES: hypothetical protein [Jonquetella]|uniref:PQ loop repeat protein n=1 Tax=Jonquetella anthropi DSM 22815 TaxID=885272 RepID=H0ULF4_9BACT|nr:MULTISPECIES: hypothetical protein [Jonquetella]EHM13513.1 hypothetical protein JonanDRAFT_1147 [Jonquetella anthropi DSM 22815]ERL24574.1 hypothetical protein HMPREF1249_1582 [Jonquetella sp. BV3C21]
MSLVNVLETVMLICFGCAWPLSIYKSWTSRTVGGKSLMFLIVILVGYAAGISKCLMDPAGYSVAVLTMYAVNIIMVTIDLVLFFRNRRFDQKRLAVAEELFDETDNL